MLLACTTTPQAIAGGKSVIPAVTPIIPIVTPTPFYIGVGVMSTFIQRDPCCDRAVKDIEDHRIGAILRLGWNYNQYVGIEARALKTFNDNVFSTTTHYGLYLKPQYKLTNRSNIYGLLGYGKTSVDYDNGVKNSENSINAFSYGAGVEYDFSEESNWGLWLDYQHLLKDEWWMHTDNSIVSVGITYKF